MLRQVRCSPFGTKLKINSSAISRRTNRSASLKSCLRPRGARLENACANSKRIYGSNSNHTDRQYWAVDSITASSTPRSRNQVDNRRRSLGRVAKRRRSGFHSGLLASTTTTISTFLCTSIPAILDIASSRRGGGERTKRRYTPSRATTLPAKTGGATQIGSKRTFQVKLGSGLALSRVATTFTVPRRLDHTPPTRPNFHDYGWAAGPCETRKLA